MLLQPTSDQEFFRETTDRFLGELAPVAELRRLRDDPAGFDAEYWRRGAELGWTSLLVGEEHGGGSISGDGLVDLTLVAHEFGAHAAPGPLVSTNVVAAALAPAGEAFADVVAGLVAGTTTAAWCTTEARGPQACGNRAGDAAPVVRVEGEEVVVTGRTRLVESGDSAAHLLVSGACDAGPTQVLVPAGTPGVSVSPMGTVDLTRRFDAVAFDEVRLPASCVLGAVGGAAADVARQRRLALVMLNAEAVGAMQTAFDMTVEWGFDRYSFGRPLVAYQALKHRFADMKVWLEASHAIADAGAAAVSGGSPEVEQLLAAAKAYIGQYGAELMQDCVQIHGGIGLTFEHDLHIYLRRHTVDRGWFGPPAAQRQLLADLAEAEEDAA